jgi:hypothetical protein
VRRARRKAGGRCAWEGGVRRARRKAGGGRCALAAVPGNLEKIGCVLRLVLARDLAEQREPDEQELEWRSSGAERGRVGEGARAEGLLRRAMGNRATGRGRARWGGAAQGLFRRAMGNRAAGRGRARWGGAAQGARTPERGEEGWPQGSQAGGGERGSGEGVDGPAGRLPPVHAADDRGEGDRGRRGAPAAPAPVPVPQLAAPPPPHPSRLRRDLGGGLRRARPRAGLPRLLSPQEEAAAPGNARCFRRAVSRVGAGVGAPAQGATHTRAARRLSRGLPRRGWAATPAPSCKGPRPCTVAPVEGAAPGGRRSLPGAAAAAQVGGGCSWRLLGGREPSAAAVGREEEKP